VWVYFGLLILSLNDRRFTFFEKVWYLYFWTGIDRVNGREIEAVDEFAALLYL
jgi:hypothetical protein